MFTNKATEKTDNTKTNFDKSYKGFSNVDTNTEIKNLSEKEISSISIPNNSKDTQNTLNSKVNKNYLQWKENKENALKSDTDYEVWKYKIEGIDTPFNSLETVQRYVYGIAKQDCFSKVWQKLGYDFNYKKESFKYNQNAKKKNLTIYKNGYGYAFGSDKGGSIFSFLDKYQNHTEELAFEYIAKVYNLEYELVKLSDFKPSKPQKATNTYQTQNKALQIDKRANKAYFENVCKEYGLELENPYFSICENGFDIVYLDLDKTPFAYNKGTFTRQRYFIPLEYKNGKTKKYNTPSKIDKNDLGYFPYLTPLAYNQNVLKNAPTLYSTEGEKKALYGCKMLNLPFYGIGGHGLGTITEKNPLTKKSIHKTAVFHSQIIELIEKENFTSYCLLLDSDTFQNKGKESRALSFFASVKKEFIAAQKVGIKEFTFSTINPNNTHNCKGLDDLGLHYSTKEIKEKLENKTHHNDLFWHFRLDTAKEASNALFFIKKAFLASAKVEVEVEKIDIKGLYIGSQLLENINSNFVTSLLCKKHIILNAPTGLGKSFFIENFFTDFAKDTLNRVVLFCSPRTALSKQQAKDGILFTAPTNKEAIERLKTEIENKNLFYCNYDNLKTAYKALKDWHNKEVFVVVDEYHLLVKDTFKGREGVIKEVFEVLNESPKNLYLSATPLKLPLSDFAEFTVHSKEKKAYKTPTLVFATQKQKLECTLDCILKSVRKNNRVMVHYNSIDNLYILKSLLQDKGIKARICAKESDIKDKDLEFFNTIQTDTNFVWNSNVEVILCTSVLEVGINLKTNRNTDLIFVNQCQNGFDLRSYLQFIARIRNYTEFEITNTIISQNLKKFFPSQSLKLDFDFTENTEFAAENANLHNLQYLKIKEKYSKVEKDRFRNKCSQDVVFNTDKEVFEVDTISVLHDYSIYENENSSPYFAAPTKVVIYQKENENEQLKEKVENIEKEKEKAEKSVYTLYADDFYTLLSSVWKLTKNPKLQSKCFLRTNPNEPIQLNRLELRFSEQLLQNHFLLAKTVKKLSGNDLECSEIKNVLVDKESQNLRKTSDLSRSKKAFITYFLLTNTDSKNRVKESIQIKELQRIISILESCKGKQISLSELLKLVNLGRYGKTTYTNTTLLELMEILTDFESKRETVNDKKITLYTIKNGKNFSKELERLKE